MSGRSFRSVFMVASCAGAALGCYLVSLNVASERASLEDVENRYGRWIIDAHIPPQGTGTQPVAAGFMANAWIRLRHPDYDVLRTMLDDVGATVQVHAG